MGKKWSPQVDPKCNFLVSLGTKVVRLSNTCIKAVAAAWRARHCGSSPYAHRRGDRFQSSFEGTPLDIYDRRANASHCPWIYYQQKAFKIHHKELTKSTVKNGKSVSGSSTYCGYNTKSEVEHIFFRDRRMFFSHAFQMVSLPWSKLPKYAHSSRFSFTPKTAIPWNGRFA